MDHEEAENLLSEVEFTAPERARLEQLRNEYAETGWCRMTADYRRLEFVRWLVINGKLTEQISW